MPRLARKGFDYYPLDVSLFGDIKIRKLIKKSGLNSVSVYICLLCMIFRDGYYLTVDDDLPFLVWEKLGVSEKEVQRSIESCVAVGLFDEKLFKQNILSSVGIQKRYDRMCFQSKRKNTIEEYDLLAEAMADELDFYEEKQQTETISSESIPHIDNKSGINDSQADISSEFIPQRKEKKSKEVVSPPISNEIVPPLENSEDKNVQVTVPAKALTLEERKHQFGLELVPYVEKYGPEMVRQFFDYWTECNEGGRKMKWEITKSKGGTFNIAGRLATWKRNEDGKFGGRKPLRKGSSISEAMHAASLEPAPASEPLSILKLLQE